MTLYLDVTSYFVKRQAEVFKMVDGKTEKHLLDLTHSAVSMFRVVKTEVAGFSETVMTAYKTILYYTQRIRIRNVNIL
jgi:hypothetical protein